MFYTFLILLEQAMMKLVRARPAGFEPTPRGLEALVLPDYTKGA